MVSLIVTKGSFNFSIRIISQKEYKNGGTVLLIYLSVLETDHEKHEFMALYAEYHAVMLRVAKKYFPVDQMAREDAVQNAWIKIVKNFQKIMAIECKKRGSYCVIIVKNECISILRKNKAKVSLDELPLAVTDDLHEDSSASITQLIREMPEKYRTVLELRFIEERSTREIAQHLNIPEAAVSTRIFRGRKLLIDRLREEGLV